MPRTRTDQELKAAAARFERHFDELDPSTVEMDDAGDLRAIALAVDAVDAAQAEVHSTVATARENGRSWNRIAVALGVSRQAARERFGTKGAKVSA